MNLKSAFEKYRDYLELLEKIEKLHVMTKSVYPQ
jgi:hypothetical protein